MQIKQLLLPFFILLLLSGCQSLQSQPLQESGMELENNHWKLVTVAGEKVVTPKHLNKDAFLQLTSQDNRANGFSGCNYFSGNYEIKDHDLKFGPVMSTMMACEDTTRTEQLLFKALTKTRHFSITEETMQLYSADNVVLATFQALAP